MAFIQCNFMSKSLLVQTSISVVIPTISFLEIMAQQKDMYEPSTKFQTLYLLHGYSGDHTDWLRYTSVERHAEEKRLALVLPAVEHSVYTDMAHGNRYWTYVSEELPRVARALFPLSGKREDNFVAGLSMGGYGAFKMAFRKPEDFAAAASLSGTLDIVELASSPNDEQMFGNVFGDLSKVRGSENDLFYLAQNLKKSNANIPRLFQACGTEDPLYQHNLRFRDFAHRIGLELTYEESPGGHDWNFWDAYIQRVLEWLPLKKQPV